MKKTLIIFSLILFLSNISQTSQIKAMENPSQPTVIYENSSFTVEEIITTNISHPKSRTAYATSTKQHRIKNNKGVEIAVFTLEGTFCYNGSTAICTQATYQAAVSNSHYSFTTCSASKSGNTAYGAYTLVYNNGSQTISNSLTLTCDKYGNCS